MPIEAVSNIQRAGVGAFAKPEQISVPTSRDLTAADIRNVLVYTAAVVLNVPASFGAFGDVIFFQRSGAGASIAFTPTSGTPRVEDPFVSPALPDGGMGALTCAAPGVWTRQC